MRAGHVVPILVSAVLPGCGHIAAGRPVKGLLLFFLFGFAVDGFFYGQAQRILPPEHTTIAPATVQAAALAAGGLVWAYAVADTARLALRRRRVEKRAAEATAHIRTALIASLRGDYRAAVRALHAALRINDQDADALFHLGVAYARTGHRRKARRALRRCIRFDHEGKWDSEAFDQLSALEASPATAPTPRPKPAKGDQREAHV